MAKVMMCTLVIFLFAPTVYMMYFSKLELRTCFIIAQCFIVFSNVIYFLQALRLNLYLGISDFAVYCFSHLFTETFEKIVTMFPCIIFVAQISAPGVESTMGSVGSTIGMIGGINSSLIGLIINKVFFDITRESIVDFYKLAFVMILGSILPLFYINRIVPSGAEIKQVHDKHLS